MLPETPLEFALQVAERVRQSIAALSFDFLADETVHITASLGMTLFRPDEVYSETLDRADCALRQAKSTGRNRIVTA